MVVVITKHYYILYNQYIYNGLLLIYTNTVKNILLKLNVSARQYYLQISIYYNICIYHTVRNFNFVFSIIFNRSMLNMFFNKYKKNFIRFKCYLFAMKDKILNQRMFYLFG